MGVLGEGGVPGGLDGAQLLQGLNLTQALQGPLPLLKRKVSILKRT